MKSLGSFFDEPMDSRIQRVNLGYFNELILSYNLTDVVGKAVCIPYENSFAVVKFHLMEEDEGELVSEVPVSWLDKNNSVSK